MNRLFKKDPDNGIFRSCVCLFQPYSLVSEHLLSPKKNVKITGTESQKLCYSYTPAPNIMVQAIPKVKKNTMIQTIRTPVFTGDTLGAISF